MNNVRGAGPKKKKKWQNTETRTPKRVPNGA